MLQNTTGYDFNCTGLGYNEQTQLSENNISYCDYEAYE